MKYCCYLFSEVPLRMQNFTDGGEKIPLLTKFRNTELAYVPLLSPFYCPSQNVLPLISVEHHRTWLHFPVDTSYSPLWLLLTYVPQESVHDVSLHFYCPWCPARRKNSINTGWTIGKANQPWTLTSLCSLSACTSFSCPRSFSCSRVRAFTVSLTLWVGDRMSDNRPVTREGTKDSNFCLELSYWCSSGPRPPLLCGMLKFPNRVLSPKYPRLPILEHNLEINSFSFLFHITLRNVLLMVPSLFSLSQETRIQSFLDKWQSLLIINFWSRWEVGRLFL